MESLYPDENLTWNEVMPFIDRIETLKDRKVHVSIAANICNISMHGYLQQTIKETKLISTWYGVIHFLRWYKSTQ